jgi:hypothetical protein
MMDTRYKSVIAGVIAAMVVGLLAIIVVGEVTSSGGGDGFNIAPFIPIWIAVWTPIMLANQREKEKRERQASAYKAKRGEDNIDPRAMIDRLLDDLTDEEIDYFQQRLEDEYGDQLVRHG